MILLAVTAGGLVIAMLAMEGRRQIRRNRNWRDRLDRLELPPELRTLT